MTDEFVVRPYAEGDRAGLLELLRQVWPSKRPLERHVERRWWWQMAPPPILLVEDPRTGTLGGLCAYMPFRFQARAREHAAAWFVDFYVLPALQGRGFGRRMTQAVQERFAVTASLSQTAMAWRVFQKLGWSDRFGVQLGMQPWPKAWMFRRHAGLDVSRFSVDPTLPVQADLDALWSRVGPAYRGIAVRSSGELVRRYAAHPGREYEIICARRGPECVGYTVVRAPGLIVDVLAHPEDASAFAALLSESARRLIALGATRLYCLATPPAWHRVLARHGFLFPDTPVLGRGLQSQTKWLTWFAADAEAIPEPAEWFVTLGDCDLDLAWHQG